jgi:cytochrome c-type biogenesis protein CcmE
MSEESMTTAHGNNKKSNQLKFIIGGILFIAAVVLLVISATRATAEFFVTVGELLESEADYAGQNLRVSGAVIGETINYDAETGLLHFTIAHIPGDEDEIKARGGLEAVLHQAVMDQAVPRLPVTYQGAPPDMLKDEAQAILTGSRGSDGVFQVEELLLKCPSKYEDALPEQVEE